MKALGIITDVKMRGYSWKNEGVKWYLTITAEVRDAKN
jgi:hypothetical protein